jgi:hypothetical protein
MTLGVQPAVTRAYSALHGAAGAALQNLERGEASKTAWRGNNGNDGDGYGGGLRQWWDNIQTNGMTMMH